MRDDGGGFAKVEGGTDGTTRGHEDENDDDGEDAVETLDIYHISVLRYTLSNGKDVVDRVKLARVVSSSPARLRHFDPATSTNRGKG